MILDEIRNKNKNGKSKGKFLQSFLYLSKINHLFSVKN